MKWRVKQEDKVHVEGDQRHNQAEIEKGEIIGIGEG